MKSISTSKLIQLQNNFAKKVIATNVLPKKIKSVCGVDVSYKDGKAHCAAVIFDKNLLKEIEIVKTTLKDTAPYIPGFFMIKESGPIFHTLKKLSKSYDILLVDGNGQLHPRLCGLACYVGLKIDKPVIGVAKSLLCGKVQSDSKIKHNGKILGYEIKRNKKKIYVSVGHKISLPTAIKVVKELILEKNWYPEPLQLADFYSKFKKTPKTNNSYK